LDIQAVQISKMLQLTTLQARELLQLHAGRSDDIDDATGRIGFLGSLRPYVGLRAEYFHEVMACIKALAPELSPQVAQSGRTKVSQSTCDKELIAAIWGICHFGRVWGVATDGMLRRNGLISDLDVMRLEAWIEQISYTTFCLLDGCDIEDAFDGYHTEQI
jgi:hypothetical protein